MIKVNSQIGFGLNVIGPELPRFLERFPDVDVVLDVESRSTDLVGEAIDVAVRLGPLPDSSLIRIRLGSMRRYLCAASSCLERCGMPASVDRLEDHSVIEMSNVDGRPRPWVFTRLGEEVRVAVRPRVTVNEALTIHRLVLNGAALGMISGYASGPDIAEGRLVHLLPEWTAPSIEVHLVFPNREIPPAVRAFADFLKEISQPGALWQKDPLTVPPPGQP